MAATKDKLISAGWSVMYGNTIAIHATGPIPGSIPTIVPSNEPQMVLKIS